jgi:hypothetical protein
VLKACSHLPAVSTFEISSTRYLTEEKMNRVVASQLHSWLEADIPNNACKKIDSMAGFNNYLLKWLVSSIYGGNFGLRVNYFYYA